VLADAHSPATRRASTRSPCEQQEIALVDLTIHSRPGLDRATAQRNASLRGDPSDASRSSRPARLRSPSRRRMERKQSNYHFRYHPTARTLIDRQQRCDPRPLPSDETGKAGRRQGLSSGRPSGFQPSVIPWPVHHRGGSHGVMLVRSIASVVKTLPSSVCHLDSAISATLVRKRSFKERSKIKPLTSVLPLQSGQSFPAGDSAGERGLAGMALRRFNKLQCKTGKTRHLSPCPLRCRPVDGHRATRQRRRTIRSHTLCRIRVAAASTPMPAAAPQSNSVLNTLGIADAPANWEGVVQCCQHS